MENMLEELLKSFLSKLQSQSGIIESAILQESELMIDSIIEETVYDTLSLLDEYIDNI